MSAAPTLLSSIIVVAAAVSACEQKNEAAGSAHAMPAGRASVAAPFHQRLEAEARGRPPVALTAEEALAAIERDGVPLDRKRQQLASPHQASYCMSAHAGIKVQLTVCEHESEERAEEHVKATNKLERPERRIAKNATTTLLARHDLNNDSEAPLVTKALRAFEQLRVGAGD